MEDTPLLRVTVRHAALDTVAWPAMSNALLRAGTSADGNDAALDYLKTSTLSLSCYR